MMMHVKAASFAAALIAVALLPGPVQGQSPPVECDLCDDYYSEVYERWIHLFDEDGDHPASCYDGAGCHEGVEWKKCYVYHAECELSALADPVLKEILDGLLSPSVSRLANLASAHPSNVSLNPGRTSVQVRDCMGRFVVDIPLEGSKFEDLAAELRNAQPRTVIEAEVLDS